MVFAGGLIIKNIFSLLIRISAIIPLRTVFSGGNYGYPKTGAASGGVF
jgi:hypothetical protein